MDKFDFYKQLANEIRERTNCDWESMSDMDRAVMKEVYLRLREKFAELIREYEESLKAIDDSLKKIECWELMNGKLEDVDVSGLMKLGLN